MSHPHFAPPIRRPHPFAHPKPPGDAGLGRARRSQVPHRTRRVRRGELRAPRCPGPSPRYGHGGAGGWTRAANNPPARRAAPGGDGVYGVPGGEPGAATKARQAEEGVRGPPVRVGVERGAGAAAGSAGGPRERRLRVRGCHLMPQHLRLRSKQESCLVLPLWRCFQKKSGFGGAEKCVCAERHGPAYVRVELRYGTYQRTSFFVEHTM